MNNEIDCSNLPILTVRPNQYIVHLNKWPTELCGNLLYESQDALNITFPCIMLGQQLICMSEYKDIH